jgi:hypothetical protein
VRANADDAPHERGSGEDWDEDVLVWNATVARIPPPAVRPDSAGDAAGAAGGQAMPRE